MHAFGCAAEGKMPSGQPARRRRYKTRSYAGVFWSPLLPNQFHPPVAGASGEGVIRFFGTGSAKALGGEAGCGDVITIDQRRLHCFGAALRQVQVVFIAANIVGVAFDPQLPGRIVIERVRDFTQYGF
jgi:hypothetical protein